MKIRNHVVLWLASPDAHSDRTLCIYLRRNLRGRVVLAKWKHGERRRLEDWLWNRLGIDAAW